MIRQRRRLLALCLLMLITMMYSLGGKTVSAEEKLFNVDDGIFVNDELPDVTWCISGKYVASNKYKLISEYDSKYYYNYDTSNGSYSETSSLDDAINDANLNKNGDSVAIYSNMAGAVTSEYFTEEYAKYKLLVYSEDGTKKYTIKYTDLPKYLGNTTRTVNVSFNCVDNVTDSAGNVVAKTYSVSGGTVNSLILKGTDNEYSFQNETFDENYKFSFYGKDGDYAYEISFTDGYEATGTFNQSGIYTGQPSLSNDFPTMAEIKNPILKLSDIPTKKCDSFELTITSDIDAQIWFNGSGNDKYSKKATFTVDSNGTFFYSASTADGGYTEGSVEIKCIKESDTSNEKWVPDDWNGEGSDTANPNIVQTGIFGSMKFLRYIGLALVLLGCGILVAKKKGISFKKGGKQS